MNDVLTKEERHFRDESNDLLPGDAKPTREGSLRGELVAIVDRLVSEVERLRARNEALPLLPKDSSDAAQEQARLMIEAAAARGKASAGGDGKVDYAYAFGWLSQDLTNTLIDMAALRARNEALERVAKAVAEITHKMYQDREARGWCQDYYNALSALAEPGKGGAT